MISLIVGFFDNILKTFFSAVSWFLNSFFRILKLFYCLLPVTCLFFVALFIYHISAGFAAVPDFTGSLPNFPGKELLSPENAGQMTVLSELTNWWKSNVFIYHGTWTYILLLLLTAVMALPVVAILVSISVIGAFAPLLFYAVVIDAALYLLRAIFSQSFVAQFLSRYYRLFPAAGKKHYEKSYEKWLRRHHDEFENDTFVPGNSRKRSDDFYSDGYDEDEDDDLYEDDDMGEDDYDEDNFELYDENADEFYEDEYYEDEDDEDRDFEDDGDSDEDYEDRSRHRGLNQPAAATSFNFFAGCSSRDSVDKKYKSLVKLYHPDNMDGDTQALQEINVQYSEAKKKFG